MDFSDTQKKVMRYVCRHALMKGSEVQIAGNGRGPWLSSCRSLARKGLMRTYRSGYYALTNEGQPVAEQLLAEWRAERATTIKETP